jgi:DNA-binding LacI/PurR family transcriptional regulator
MVTLRQIAAQTGLSISTVSHILNRNSQRYNAQTRDRVMEAAKTLGYTPNRYAQVIRQGRSGIVGMIQHAGLLQVAVQKGYAAASAILNSGYRLLANDAEWKGRGIETVCSTMLDLRVEGLLLIDPPAIFPLDMLNTFKANGIPVVALGGVRLPGVPLVRVDARDGMEQLTRHMLGLGHRRMRLVVPTLPPKPCPTVHWGTLERVEGFQTVIREAGLSEKEASVYYAGLPNDLMTPYANGKAAMESLLASPRRPEALLFSNDDWAIGALSACAEAGVRVPQDIALTGFDNSLIGAYAFSPLTTLAQDFEGMAREAGRLLLEGIQAPATGPAPEIKICGKLVIRRSCGAPAAP